MIDPDSHFSSLVNRDQRSGHHRSNHSNHNDGRNQERVPEWMDYNPDIKKTADLDDKSDRRGEFANDLEAWKSSMKKKEGLTADTVEKQPMAASMEGNTLQCKGQHKADMTDMLFIRSATPRPCHQ